MWKRGCSIVLAAMMVWSGLTALASDEPNLTLDFKKAIRKAALQGKRQIA